jgi:hypothetical protein
MIDSTRVRANRSPGWRDGGRKRKLRAVRAEGATQRSMHSQMLGAVIAILLTEGEARDCPVVERLNHRLQQLKGLTRADRVIEWDAFAELH